jgi:UDPglucose--hexose-1-phosphate uridylyltransferase
MPPSGEWQVRVIRNKFPALSLLGSRERMFDGVHRRISGVGYHEVLIETPRHNSCPALETKEEVTAMMRAFSLRGKSIAQDERIEQIVYFKNHGQRAGTSMVHPHTQLIGLPVVSHDIRARVEEARRFFDDTGLCVYCKVLEDEIRDASRIVVEGKHFVAFIPYASFSPFHTWILPRRHEPSFLNITPEELEDLGNVLRTVIRKMYIGLHDPDYNYIIRSAPLRDLRQEYLHWYLTIVTRTSQSAGFELGSGMFINPTYPEDSAEFLRSVAAEG